MILLIYLQVYSSSSIVFIMDNKELKRRREQLGLTQVEFADLLGYASNTVSRYETGTLEIPKYLPLVLEALENRQIGLLKKTIENNSVEAETMAVKPSNAKGDKL